jgi:type IV pilus assembly protein PilB
MDTKTSNIVGTQTINQTEVQKPNTIVGTNNIPSTTTPNKKASVKGLSNLLDALLLKGIINLEEFNSIKFEAINGGVKIVDLLIQKGIVTSEEIARTQAEMKSIGFIDLSNISIPVEVIQKLDISTAKENSIVIFEELPTKFKVAMEDPLDLQKVKYLESLVGKNIEAYFASKDAIENIINTKYGAQLGTELDEALEEVGDVKTTRLYGDANLEEDEALGSAPIIKIVNMILEYAINHKASDIHIEPRDGKISVRFRIRGVLSEKLSFPKKLLSSVVTRIKILSSLKIDEHRIPQDGRFQIRDTNNIVDIRVSIMPSIYGEKIVMRVLEKTKGIMDLEETGMRGSTLARMKESVSKTQGIILVTGPTGSGKTQTVASVIKILNSPEVNIITLEDPVEIRVDGVNQVQVNTEVGLTFASGLRAILRQDPDVIFVGEIRDAETATLAVQSALVGRLVLSTIHTNSAAGAFIRLIDMGIEPFLLTSTVNLVVAQRLVRVLCDVCKQPYNATPEIIEEIHEVLDPLHGISFTDKDKNTEVTFTKDTKNLTLYHPVGCSKCNDSGYISRVGIFEALKMSDSISKLVLQKSTIKDIGDLAIAEGMLTMVQDGFIKALQGITTLEEVLRVKNE